MFEHPAHGHSILGRRALAIVVEIDPGSSRAALLDSYGPLGQLVVRIVVPVPALRAVQPQVNFISGANQIGYKTVVFQAVMCLLARAPEPINIVI